MTQTAENADLAVTTTGDEMEDNLFEQMSGIAGDVRDPYPDINAKRSECPVHKVDLRAELGLEPDSDLGDLPEVYTVFGHDEVREVLKDAQTFSSAGYAQIMGQVMGHTILEMDGKEHLQHRYLVAQAFRAKVLERWGNDVIGGTIHELIDTFADRGHADLVRELTFVFPVKVIARILGLPESDWLWFQRKSIELISVSIDMERALKASAELKDYFSAIITERRKDPKDDLISTLVKAEMNGEKLSDEEIYPFLRLLLPAGAETTFRSSGNLFYGLLTNPDVLEAVRNDRSLIPQAIEEALRWEPPLLFIQRTATKDVEMAGVTIPEGAMVAISMAGANRDPKVYDDPDRFDIYREQPQGHLSFAYGPHMCLGMHLARLETKLALEAILDRLPNLRLDPDKAVAADAHIHGQTFRSPTSLPVLFDPAP